jgi:hypothetical protein
MINILTDAHRHYNLDNENKFETICGSYSGLKLSMHIEQAQTISRDSLINRKVPSVEFNLVLFYFVTCFVVRDGILEIHF